MTKPLAEILRPTSLDHYIGQEHLMGEGAILRTAIESGQLHSMILWGPPGVGKTTLALLIAELTNSQFYMLSAISSGVKEIREVFDKARENDGKTILFIDEIHRFSKAQQDSLLGAVEQGLVTLIGATTENPSFEVISPLLSRCQVYILKSLEKNDLEKIIAIAQQYYKDEQQLQVDIPENEALLRISGGDARKLLNAIELSVSMQKPQDGVVTLTNEWVQKVIQKNLAIYDKKGENHYDIISAFIKSVRGSDPNAAVYWMARMLSAGEDPLFIARRMIILASEDIGNANPNALLLANNCFQAVHHIGMPEARIVMSQTAIYLASSPKSNSAIMAIDEAYEWVQKTGDLSVPLHLRNAPTKLMKELDYSKGYKYAHAYDNNFVEQEFLPESISGKKFYEPQNNARENDLRRYLKNCWKEKYKYVVLLIAFVSCFLFGWSQDMHYSQYYTMPASINPAMTGAINGTFRITLNHKLQWLAITKPYTSVSGGFDAPIVKGNKRRTLVGLGVQVHNDRAGDSKYNIFQVSGSISVVKSLDRRNRNKIGIGFAGGIFQHTIDYSALTFDEQYIGGLFDPNNPISEAFGRDKYLFFDCSAGLVWSCTPREDIALSAGFTVNHLTEPNQTHFSGVTAKLYRKYVGTFSARFPTKKNVFIHPMVYAAFQGKHYEILFGSLFEYEWGYKKNRDFALGGGLFYRVGDALVASFFFDWRDLRFSVAYDCNISTLSRASKARGGYEVSLSYIFKKHKRIIPGKEPCPYKVM
ncbi:MAG: PorP/SprF family type IX secretion system membrane protein [Bacteroidales bacterium]|nr:PorP/SprF family type IX secretion system membrane protein [Bacteroidales bacterium]